MGTCWGSSCQGVQRQKALPDKMGCFGSWVIARTEKVLGATWGLSALWECQKFSKSTGKKPFKILFP